jgi:hypothetical protein
MIGDRVIYVSNTYGVSDSNPLYKKYKVVGTVVEIYEHIGLRLYVKWDNGFVNSYYPDDVELFNPNSLLNKIREHYV